ncbi:MAG: hypothetical protein KF906_11730, partial [Actinobacteria bacterium]|nr:hypothetical protein [Actinomycetota bacterium]
MEPPLGAEGDASNPTPEPSGSGPTDLPARYLQLVAAALVDDLYLENEARIAHLVDCVTRPKPVELPRLRDPLRHDRPVVERLREDRRVGRITRPDEGADPLGGYAYAPGGRPALARLDAALDAVAAGGVPGELVSCAEGRAGAGVYLRAHLAAHERTGPDVWVVGRFRAAADDRAAPDEADGLDRLRPDLNQQRDAFSRFGLLDERVHLLQGDPDATLA